MRLIAIFVSLILAVIAMFVVFQWSQDAVPMQTSTIIVEKPVEKMVQEPTEQIFVAQKDIAPGSELTPELVDRQDWPKRLIADNFMVVGKDDPAGMIARGKFEAREPLIKSKLGKQGDPSFVAATLPEGQRLVTIATDGIAGVAGFIFPGDHVDIVLTHVIDLPDPDNKRNPIKKEQISEVLLPNILVVAVDQSVSATTDEKTKLPSSVSLQVPAQEVQMLRLAERRGTLSLALRSLKDTDETVPDPTTRFDITRFLGVVEPKVEEGEDGQKPKNALSPMAPPKEPDMITVVRGTKAQTVEIEGAKQ